MTAATTFEIDGMTCAACVGRAERVLRAVPGVTAAEVRLADRTARVAFAGVPDVPALGQALDRAGYALVMADTALDVGGMTCAACVGRVEGALRAVPGVVSATVNPATHRASVRHAASPGAVDRLIAALAAAGYAANPADPAADRAAASLRAEGRRLALAAALALPVVALEMGGHLIPAVHHWVAATIGMGVSWWVQAVLATAILAGPGRGFLTRGVAAARHGAPDMNTLVALGTSAAWAWSVLVLLAPGLIPASARAVYFEAASVIVVLVMAGRWMEGRARGAAGAAIRRLVALAPSEALVETADGVVPRASAALRPGDVVHIRPGARLPADGIVAEGTSTIDESMLTGEPMPAARGPGDAVTGGTVNGTGFLRVTVTRAGADTTLAQIVRLVETAQGARLPVQALVDRVTAVFVPAVLAVAVLAAATWLLAGGTAAQALVAAVSVLIIACPCAMGLATPMSITVAAGRAAERGVLFRRGEALQRLATVRTVAFDKTGTLTEGRPALAALIPAAGMDRDAVLADVAAVEAQSEHPVAHAIVAAAAGLALPAVSGFAAEPGRGVRATVAGRAVLVGSARFLDEAGVSTAPLADIAAARAAEGQTVLFAAIDGRLAALLAVADTLRPGAAAAVAALRAQGVAVAMVSGDAPATAQAVARTLNIGTVFAGQLPSGKLSVLDGLKAAGPVAFVGDGINDAPALAAADTGIAMGTGTDVAIEAADVVVTRGDPCAVADALAISRATMRNVRQNLIWAFGYNIALIPVAAGALVPFGGPMLSPMLAAGAMAASSVMVVGNALRLRRAGGGA